MRLILPVLAIAILAQPLSADIICFPTGCQDGGLFGAGTDDLPAGDSTQSPSQLARAMVRQWLTFKSEEADRDKDGFLEGVEQGVNPTGYVVFHFRSASLNERITLGDGGAGLLDVPMMRVGGGYRPPEPEPIVGGDDVPGPPPPAPPNPVPEPGVLLLLATGATVAVLRRRAR